MGFAKLERLLAQSGLFRRFDVMIGFMTYREVRELGRERRETARE